MFQGHKRAYGFLGLQYHKMLQQYEQQQQQILQIFISAKWYEQ